MIGTTKPPTQMSELTTNECKHRGRMHDQKISSRTWPRITPQLNFLAMAGAYLFANFGPKISYSFWFTVVCILITCPVNQHPLFLFWKRGSVCYPEKNQFQNMDLKKAGFKKQGHWYWKREEAAWHLFFLSNNVPIFCNLLFSGPYIGLDFFLSSIP